MLCNNNKKNNYLNYKLNQLLFIIIVVLFIFAIKYVNFSTNIQETTKKPIGHKIYNAEFFDYDPNSDKYRIIIAEGEGGSGEGGGQSGGGNSNVSGEGSINGSGYFPGGTSGGGNNSNAGSNGTGIGSSNNNTGNQSSNIAAEALRKKLEEQRQESIAKVLETALNRQQVEESIAQRESIYESIQKRIKQESINARINSDRYNTVSPTVNVVIETIAPQEFPTMLDTSYNAPVSSVEYITPEESIISPTATEEDIKETIAETTLKTFDMPIVEVELKETTKNIGPDSEIVESSDVVETSIEETTVETQKETIDQNEKETDIGGGNNDETTLDNGQNDLEKDGALGNDDSNDDSGNLVDGNLDGFGFADASNNHQNIKILELDRDGGLGILELGKSKSILNKLLLIVILILMFLGSVKYALPFFIKTKNKKSYF